MPVLVGSACPRRATDARTSADADADADADAGPRTLPHPRSFTVSRACTGAGAGAKRA